MVRLNRLSGPSELTDKIRNELTATYLKDDLKDVWKDSRIYKPIKDQLMAMSNGKCAYCESRLDKENNYFTVEHSFPKSINGFKVLEWRNLLPSCGPCNGAKSDFTEEIVDPSVVNPKEHLEYDLSIIYFQLRERNGSIMGKNTIKGVALNRFNLRKERMIIAEKTKETCVDICSRICKSINSTIKDGRTVRLHYNHRDSFYSLLVACRDENYATAMSTGVWQLPIFHATVKLMKSHSVWSQMFDAPYKAIKEKELCPDSYHY